MSTHIYKHTLRNMMESIFASERDRDWLQKTTPPKNENRVLSFSIFKKGSLQGDAQLTLQ